MRGLIAYFVDRSLLVNLITVAVIVAGGLVATGTTRALMPDAGYKRIEVEARLPGASAVDVERFVTFRLEEALQGMDLFEKVTSTTTNGSTTLRLDLKPNVQEITRALEKTRSRLSRVAHLLPKDLRPLRIEEQPRGDTWMMGIILEHVDFTRLEHRQAVQTLRDQIARVPEVLNVYNSSPGRNLYIRFDSKRLANAGISVAQARERIATYLVPMPVGTIRVHDQRVAVELIKPFDALEKLRAIPLLVNRAGRGVMLGDVASVEYDTPEKDWVATIDGEPYAELHIEPVRNADAINAAASIRAILEEAKGELLPPPITTRISYDISEIIHHELSTLQSNGLTGILLVVVILAIFLGWRISTMTALGLPFCYLGVVLVLNALDMNFNIITLIAMILVVGILVDDAILVSEEFSEEAAAGKPPREAAINAVMRVGKPVLGMVATTTVAFLPLMFIESNEYWFLEPLAVVVVAALFLSLFESFLLLPNHLSHFMQNAEPPPERRWLRAARVFYERGLRLVLRLRYVAAVGVAGLVALSAWLLTGPVAFEPDVNINGETSVFIELNERAGSVEELAAAIRPVQAVLRDLPEDLPGNHHKLTL